MTNAQVSGPDLLLLSSFSTLLYLLIFPFPLSFSLAEHPRTKWWQLRDGAVQRGDHQWTPPPVPQPPPPQQQWQWEREQQA